MKIKTRVSYVTWMGLPEYGSEYKQAQYSVGTSAAFSDLETFLSLASPCYVAAQGHDSTQKISSDDMKLLCGAGWSAHGNPPRTLRSSKIQVKECYHQEVEVALSMSAGSIEITDWRSELCTSCEDLCSQSQALAICDQQELGIKFKFYQRSHLQLLQIRLQSQRKNV